MNILLQVVVFTVPTIVVGTVAYLIINKMLKAENMRRNHEIHKMNAKTLVPAKLQACERMALFLERVSPESLLMRQNLKNTNALQLQTVLLQQIRQEWEHNLSQQLYISSDTWIVLKNAKESIIQLINTCAAEAQMNFTTMDFAKLILETYHTVQSSPIDVAMSMLKKEISNLG